MQYVCDAPKGKTWFRIETEGEAAHESRLMNHTVEKYFHNEREKAVQSWRPERPNAIEARHRPRGPCTARDAGFPHVARQGGQCTGYSDAATGRRGSRQVPDHHRCRIQCRSLSRTGRGHRCAGSAFRSHTRSPPLLPLRPLRSLASIALDWSDVGSWAVATSQLHEMSASLPRAAKPSIIGRYRDLLERGRHHASSRLQRASSVPNEPLVSVRLNVTAPSFAPVANPRKISSG